ncbi:alanine dehydrogenase [Phytoactinopolyspora halotolerans]|uniref:Alanine dehydrogenase n=1 Tax=Phytoactinopolyspora halotolerans TaxID=1981512 RepID=A0A6L9S7M1_9ACTN|nr:alanine dehydrogenase [Phytoactinopolyspora halotolerans]NEE00983.1 alanine dehydrogenase [Phytoactinopolyspora halotolerans]
MKVGIPREVKNHEYRVAVTPAGVRELSERGHDVYVERHAGAGSAIGDDDYLAAGAKILDTADDVWAEAELVLKVKEPVAEEYPRMRAGQVLFTYLHLAASRACTDALLERRVTGIAYETVQRADGALPLLAPMSEVAGRLAPQVGAYHLMRSAGGRGVLPGGIPGVRPAEVVVIGAGVSGMNATAIAVGMGAAVTVLDLDVDKLRAVDARYTGRVRTVAANAYEIERAVLGADLVIGAVLVPGAHAPRVVTLDTVARMKAGAVLVDIAVDQGGCFEGTRPTTHDAPTFAVHDTVYYCVANMPGAVPATSTHALTNATLPYALRLADLGWREAVRHDDALARGLSTHDGRLLSAPVAAAFDLPHDDGLLGAGR